MSMVEVFVEILNLERLIILFGYTTRTYDKRFNGNHAVIN